MRSLRSHSVLSMLCAPWFLCLFIAASKDTCPQIGSRAPDAGITRFFQTEGKKWPGISRLHGSVVLVHQFAPDCPMCALKGIPLAVETAKANADRGLKAISVTIPHETLADIVREHGIEHTVGLTTIQGGTCPYVDVYRNGFTYAFVIDRNGKVLWRGDHAANEKDYFKAVHEALNQEVLPLLERETSSKLEAAISLYYKMDLEGARKLARKAKNKYAKKSGEKYAAVTEDAAYLAEKIDGFGAELLERMKEALDKQDATKFAKAARLLAEGFKGSEEADEAAAIEKQAASDAEFAADLEAAEAWIALGEARPAFFPARRDGACKSFASKVKKYLKKYDGRASAKDAKDLLVSLQ